MVTVLGCIAGLRLSNATISLRRFDTSVLSLVAWCERYASVSRFCMGKEQPDRDLNTVRMAEEIRTQNIGDVNAGPNSQSFVGNAGGNVIFSNTVDPKGGLHVATTLQHCADPVMPHSGPRQSDRRLPQRTLPHQSRSRPRDPHNCQRDSSPWHV